VLCFCFCFFVVNFNLSALHAWSVLACVFCAWCIASCVVDQKLADDSTSSQAELSVKTADDDVKSDSPSTTVSGEADCEVAPSAAADSQTPTSSSDDSIVDQWRRSIVVNDVPEDIVSNVIMHLELKSRGGGHVDSHTYHAQSRNLLVTFRDAAGKSINQSCIIHCVQKKTPTHIFFYISMNDVWI